MTREEKLEVINKADVLIVGTGFTGATYAELLTDIGYNVVLIDKRDHIAGNAYTERVDGIDIHRYGAHIFHTPNQFIWDYVNKFGDWHPYEHRVLAVSHGQVFTLPFTLKTLSEVYGYHMTPEQGRELIEKATRRFKSTDNLEEKALSLIGQPVYDDLIREYTMKQWGVHPRELDPNIITRLPVRMNYDTRYFNDKFQGIPTEGYTAIIDEMIYDCTVFTETDWFDIRDEVNGPFVIYTGPVDQFFDYKHGKLGWRSVKFDTKHVDTDDFQGIPVMNYCDSTVAHTRIIEHKHFNPLPNQNGTWISYEQSCSPSETIDPYYPINTSEDRLTMALYKIEVEKIQKDVKICGRLGSYKYLDMHQAIGIVFKDIDEVSKLAGAKVDRRF